MEKKSYIILTEFNEWVGTSFNITMDELKEEVEEIRERLVDNGSPEDTKIVIFEVNPPSFEL